jgi:hypothetical protein
LCSLILCCIFSSSVGTSSMSFTCFSVRSNHSINGTNLSCKHIRQIYISDYIRTLLWLAYKTQHTRWLYINYLSHKVKKITIHNFRDLCYHP